MVEEGQRTRVDERTLKQEYDIWKKRDMVLGSDSKLTSDLDERSFSSCGDRSPKERERELQSCGSRISTINNAKMFL